MPFQYHLLKCSMHIPQLFAGAWEISTGMHRINFLPWAGGYGVLQNLMIIFLTGDHKVLLIIMIIKVICLQ